MWEGFGFPLRKDYVHVTDKYDSGLEVGTPGLNEKGIPVKAATATPAATAVIAKPAPPSTAPTPAASTPTPPAAPNAPKA
jgi:hypothetical protein